eukprot:gnl/MRDRNA2_/MRDRNA2_125207_c0_seq1.p1 gnl/MRDRNA2_/MRDRNA2_125207_c0~~gnl/MRDRNA2_/MRDRNA2_125207_c0_seq1.p1  ORF type:complete len:413 (+),score=55.25 gnl/MRDRNA2_/MRDRNA2_125207_c0_seq1:100-1338(+)
MLLEETLDKSASEELIAESPGFAWGADILAGCSPNGSASEHDEKEANARKMRCIQLQHNGSAAGRPKWLRLGPRAPRTSVPEYPDEDTTPSPSLASQVKGLDANEAPVAATYVPAEMKRPELRCSKRKRWLNIDLSDGNESKKIRVCAHASPSKLAPLHFKYIRVCSISTEVQREIQKESIFKCRVAQTRNSYDSAGRLNRKSGLGTPILENGEHRVVRAGLRFELEVFWVNETVGWGVRTLADIDRSTFVCEYAGEVITDAMADERAELGNGQDRYHFNLPSFEDMKKWPKWLVGNMSLNHRACSLHQPYVIDSYARGNVARFFNHCCVPSDGANLDCVYVFADSCSKKDHPSGFDARLPRLAFFTNRKVEKGEELRFDYGQEYWKSLGKRSDIECFCGSEACRGRKRQVH